MAKIFYPALFHPEESGYSVSVPDLEGCYTQGETLEEALAMVQEAIGLYLDGSSDAPAPSAPESIEAEPGDFLMVVAYDPLAYERRHNTRAVKKTLTIPSWLNDAAEAAHLNFSSVLRSALEKQLDIDN